MMLDEEAEWDAVGRHRFDASDELDASLALSLGVDARRVSRRYGVDPEAAENLLATAREADTDLSVSLRIADREVKVDTDGVIAVRTDT
ncbi:hypothetical protein SAMN04488063_2599 [Halopelagius inordinatus]|uniref:Halobacterial output domain-containing protein n=1 Tax=Halopelagius inordinatus TaxID=553467 RepID=A0A1I2TAD0_9EURY|nr:HalOD1 output domain-containing protein [Halopelagius inordinatus]SFG61845.1 hypothetical protein SAMN04488063_2599 [Halopelagius inordinatus]